MLPDFYHNHLVKIRTLSEYLITLILVKLLNIYREVKLEELANKFHRSIVFESRRKKIMRFLFVPILTIETIWFPIVKAWLPRIYNDHEKVHIVIDRTQWKSINLIVVSLIINKRGIPLYFELLDHTGSSDFELQVKILSLVFPLFKNYQIVVLGDREFCSVKLAHWLNQQKNILYSLRLRKNTFISFQEKVWKALKDLGLKPGLSVFYQGIKITKTKGFIGSNIAGKWKGKYRGIAPDEAWFILTNFSNLEDSIEAYKIRFGIVDAVAASRQRRNVP